MDCYAFIGIQGSGKGTQAVKLSSALQYQHINIGDLFRYHVQNQTELGLQVQSIIQKGELVPDDLVFQLVAATTNPDAKGIVFDGFPRTIAQAEYLLTNYNLLKVFYLQLDEETAIRRISARRVCQNCQANYNIDTQPPRIVDTCDICGGKLIIRADDMPDAIRKRFQEFHEQTLPLKQMFEQHKILVVIDASRSVDEVFSEIMKNTR
ncbi:MAG TPA: nucleoside monophosphate kinase [Candidatus Cloacimonadota bacterium]|nr:nucleoside monophosphate kinase [Candidatus Cloacimonadota bacterium]